MLVRTFEDLVMEVRKRLPKLAVSRITTRSYNKLKDYIVTMSDLYHVYRRIKRRGVNLWGL